MVLWGLYYPSLSRASCLSRRLNQNWSACIKETSHLVLQPGASPPFPCPLRSSWPLPPPRESLLPGSPLGSVASGGLLYLCRGWELCKRLMPQCDSVVVLVINFQSAKFKSLMRVKVELLEERKSAGPHVPKAMSRTLCEASAMFPVQGKPVVTPARPHS